MYPFTACPPGMTNRSCRASSVTRTSAGRAGSATSWVTLVVATTGEEPCWWPMAITEYVPSRLLHQATPAPAATRTSRLSAARRRTTAPRPVGS